MKQEPGANAMLELYQDFRRKVKLKCTMLINNYAKSTGKLPGKQVIPA